MYVAVAFIGGICGAYFGSLRFKQTLLNYAGFCIGAGGL